MESRIDNLIGERLGQYEITSLIGVGGMATVYSAWQTSIGRDVAIKVLRAEPEDMQTFILRFEREAQIMASLSHPHILKVFDFGQHDSLVYLVTELIRGGTLADLIKRGALSLEATVRLINQIAPAIDYAHQRGIIHRDLKPRNVLLDEHGNPSLADFGLAKIINQNTEWSGKIKLGTPAYMSPEEWDNAEIDNRTDLYSLGVMLFEMLTGTVPFKASSLPQIMQMHLQEPMPSIRAINPAVPVAVERVVERAMEKRKEDRFASAGELGLALNAALVPAPVNMPMHPPISVAPSVPVSAPAISPQTMRNSCLLLALFAVIVSATLFISVSVAVLNNPSIRAALNETETPVQITLVPTGRSTSLSVPTIIPTIPTAVAIQPTVAPTAAPAIPMSALGKVAFSTSRGDGTNDIYVINIDGSEATALVTGVANDYGAVWSHDGTSLAFTSNRDGDFEIYIVDADGANLRALTNNAVEDFDPSWSPDDRYIAFVSERDGNREIYIADIASANAQNFTRTEAMDWFPAWSPDGQNIAFTSNRGGNNDVYLMNIATGNVRNLTQRRADDIYAAWSPDGTLLAFNTNRDGNYEVYILDMKDQSVTNISDNPADDRFATWSPDGEYVAFSSNRDGNFEIYIVDYLTRESWNLTNDTGYDFFPSWQP